MAPITGGFRTPVLMSGSWCRFIMETARPSRQRGITPRTLTYYHRSCTMTALNVTPEQLIAIHDGLIILIEQYQDDAYTGDDPESGTGDDPFLQHAKDALALVSNAMD